MEGRSNYHSHSLYCDGRAGMEDFVRFALSSGFTSYGFSSHAPLPFPTAWTMEWDRMDDYVAEFRRLKEKYAGRIELYLGLEIDYLNEKSHPAIERFRRLPLDYRIGSVHLLYDDEGRVVDADLSAEKFRQMVDKHFQGDVERVVRLYYERSRRMVELGGFDIVGHADKIHYNAAYCRPGILEEPWYDRLVRDYFAEIARRGYQVEINALWYNAICYTLKLAGQAGDNKFVKEWKDMPDKVKESFLKVFWNEEKGYLADFVNGGGQNVFVRPNQVIACSLEYSPLSDEMIHGVLDVVKNELLTPKGLRTLAPKNPAYEGTYEGDQATRDRAYHQGTVWPWLLGPYIEANFRLYGKKFAKTARELLANFEEDMTVYGVCSIGEIYDGNPPYTPNGCISQAWSVGEILRSMALLEKFCKDDR